MRAVLDTNVIISGFLWKGTPRKIIDLILQGTVTSCTSLELLSELHEVLAYPRIQKRLRQIQRTKDELLSEFRAISETVVLSKKQGIFVPHDEDDDIVILTALDSKARFIITGDEHLLSLNFFLSILIVSPADFIAVFSS